VTGPEARHIHKNRTRHQEGFKAHVSFEPETGLFTAAGLTGGGGTAGHEAAVAVRLLDGEEGVTVLGDAAYGTGELRRHLRDGGHAAVIKPPPLRQVIPRGFTIDDFTVDDQAGTVTCPAGRTAALGRPQAGGARVAQFKALCNCKSLLLTSAVPFGLARDASCGCRAHLEPWPGNRVAAVHAAAISALVDPREGREHRGALRKHYLHRGGVPVGLGQVRTSVARCGAAAREEVMLTL
jgi:hypothetical protein